MLECTDLTVQYANGAIGVQGVTVKVAPGTVTALFGPTGAGKTTTIRGMSGFLKTEGARVVSGSVTVDGRRLESSEPFTFSRAGIALVPERRKVFPDMTVAENLQALRLPPRKDRAEAYESALELFPRLRAKMRQTAGLLSGGEQQMLAVARALVRKPKFLLVDEMTLGLHVSLMEPLFEAMREIASRGTGILLVDESIAKALEVCDYCYLVRNGELVDEGPPDKYRGNELLAAGYVGDV
jgi:branched-chain amino acid transport system ATP-binding protein